MSSTVTTVPTVIPGGKSAKGWTQAKSWIEFFKLLQEGKQVWVRVATQINPSAPVEEVEVCGSSQGFFLERELEPESDWLHHFKRKEWVELREVLGVEKGYLDSLAELLGGGLK